MNIGKKLLALSLFFAVLSSKAITRDELVAIGSVLREAHHLKSIIPYKEADQYVFTPATAIGDFMWNLDVIEPELQAAVKGIKNFRALATCSKLKASSLEAIKKPESQLSGALLQAKKLCEPVACTGDKTACLIHGIRDLSFFLSTAQKILFGYYKVDGKVYIKCPEGKNCTRVPGAAEITFKVAQQESVYKNILNPKVNEPLDKVINILDQLERILMTLKGASKDVTPSTQVPAPAPVPAAPMPKPTPAPEQTSSTIPEAPKLEETSSNIPDAPPLEERSNIPVAPPLVPSAPAPRPTVKPAQPMRPVTQPTQKPAQQESMIGDKLRQDVAKALEDRRKAMAPEENWE